jgi:hypothetical protein
MCLSYSKRAFHISTRRVCHQGASIALSISRPTTLALPDPLVLHVAVLVELTDHQRETRSSPDTFFRA